MADRTHVFHSTVAAFGAAAPTFTFPRDGQVEQIDVRFRRGCMGLVTVTVLYGNALVIPYNQSTTLAGDDETFEFVVDNLPTGQGWQAGINNNDTLYPHTVDFIFHVNELDVLDDTALPQIILMPQV